VQPGKPQRDAFLRVGTDEEEEDEEEEEEDVAGSEQSVPHMKQQQSEVVLSKVQFVHIHDSSVSLGSEHCLQQAECLGLSLRQLVHSL